MLCDAACGCSRLQPFVFKKQKAPLGVVPAVETSSADGSSVDGATSEAAERLSTAFIASCGASVLNILCNLALFRVSHVEGYSKLLYKLRYIKCKLCLL